MNKLPIRIHPGRSTWNLKITQLKRKIIFQTIIFRFRPLIFQGVIFFYRPYDIMPGLASAKTWQSLASLLCAEAGLLAWRRVRGVQPKMIEFSPPKMGVSKNKGTPKWMVHNGKTLLKWMIWGTPIFGNTQMNIVFGALGHQNFTKIILQVTSFEG